MSTNTQPIPFLDLITPHRDLEEELVEVFGKALGTAGFIGGPMVEDFEYDFARFCDTKYCVGVGSGTDALRFALIAAGVEPGDIVITVPNTFIATTESISQAGALPEFVDIDERTYNMDSEKLRQHLETRCSVSLDGNLVSKRKNRKVTAIVPVHLYGQMADMDRILELAAQYHLIVIEDACQAHGAEYFSRKHNRWFKAGSMGRAAAFSFYPGKNLGALGEAGAVTSNDEGVIQRVRLLRDHGQSRKYYHDIEGYNGRLDALQAGILHVKLKHLPDWNDQRRKRAAQYHKMFENSEILTTLEPLWSRAVYHLYVVRVSDREGLIGHLKQASIGTGIHYPIPLHLQKAYKSLGYVDGDFTKAEEAAATIVSLPMFPNLTCDQQQRVAREVRQFVESAEIAVSSGYVAEL